MTYEEILNRVLSRVSDSLDKREGSVVFDMVAPACAEIAILYIELERLKKEIFADTASREALILRAKERGIEPKKATKSVIKAKANIAGLPVGAKFSIDLVNFIITKDLGSGDYSLECEEFGTVGNISVGDLIPVEYHTDLEYMKISGIAIPAQDDEDTEEFRARYLESFKTKGIGGNKADYINKVKQIEGVGAVKVTPVYAGGGTVKLTILDGDYNIATAELIKKVQGIIDPTKDGTGQGLAPIGHKVLVDTPREEIVDIGIKCNNFNILKPKFEEVINDYFRQVKRDWSKGGAVIKYNLLLSKLFDVEGLDDITEFTINKKKENIRLNDSVVRLGALHEIH